MNADQPPSQTAAAKDAQCDRCGSFDAAEFAGQVLCTDCIAQAGCGCAGHGDQDDQ